MKPLHTDVVRAIKIAKHHGYPVAQIVEVSGLHRRTISLIVNGHTHKHVQITNYDKAMHRSLTDLFRGLAKRPQAEPEIEAEKVDSGTMIDRMEAARTTYT